MARIKIEDLSRDMEISADEMRRVRGGSLFARISFKSSPYYPKVELGSSLLLNDPQIFEAKY